MSQLVLTGDGRVVSTAGEVLAVLVLETLETRGVFVADLSITRVVIDEGCLTLVAGDGAGGVHILTMQETQAEG